MQANDEIGAYAHTHLGRHWPSPAGALGSYWGSAFCSRTHVDRCWEIKLLTWIYPSQLRG